MEQKEGKYLLGKPEEIKGTKGYLVGAFMESAGYSDLQNESLEIAVLDLPVCDESKPHYHKVMTEINYVISGKLDLVVDGEELVAEAGQFFVIKPGTVLQNPTNDPGTRVVVVKSPSLPDDKYYVES